MKESSRMLNVGMLKRVITVWIVMLTGALWCTSTGWCADLQQIREELRELQTSIESIRLEYTIVATKTSYTQEVVYLQSGPAIRLIQREPTMGVQSESFDGEFGYLAFWAPKDAKPGDYRYPSTIRKKDGIPGVLLGACTPMKCFGMPVSAINKPLWELLEKATIVGESTFRDWRVVELDLGEWPDRIDRMQHVQCKLAIDHGYIPVEIIARPEGSAGSHYVVDVLREVEHPLLNSSIWFPEACTFRPDHDLGAIIKLSKIELNPSIARSEFIPEPETGTSITDETAPGGKKTWVHGDDIVRERIIEAAATSVPPLDSGVAAVAEPPLFRWWYGLVAAAIVFSVAGWLWRFRS